MPFYNPIWYRHKGKVTPTAFNYTLASIAIPANPNWSLERCGICVVTSPVFQVILSCCHADCMPVCPNLACYAFDKDSNKSAPQQNESTFAPKDRLELKKRHHFSHLSYHSRSNPLGVPPLTMPSSTVLASLFLPMSSNTSTFEII